MRTFFNLIFQLVMAALVIFLFTAFWLVFDGLSDQGQKADVALVTGPSEIPQNATEQPRLDRAIKLYNDGEIPVIIVSGYSGRGTYGETAAMTKYLESHGIPSNAIIANHEGENTQETAREVAEIMKSHQFESIMIVTDYYRMARTRLALGHEGVPDIQRVHVGKLQKEDAWKIGREVVAFYDYVGKVYFLPVAEKVKEEAKIGADKAKVDAEEAKAKVNKGLDNMAR